MVFKYYDPNKNKYQSQESRKYCETFYYTENLKVMPTLDNFGIPAGDPYQFNKEGLCIIQGVERMHMSLSKMEKVIGTREVIVNTPQGKTTQTVEIKDMVKIPDNNTGINIFGRNQSGDQKIIKYGEYSSEYRMFKGKETRTIKNKAFRQEGLFWSYYTPAYAQNRLDWVEIAGDNKPIIPYYYWNQYPFRYEENKVAPTASNGYGEYNLIKLNYSDGENNPMSKPMPSVLTNPRLEKTVNIELNFKKFSIGDEETTIIVKIPIVYEVRQCHMNYMGHNEFITNSTKYSNINGQIHENIVDGVTEYAGEHSSFTELDKFTKDMNVQDDRKKAYNAMKLFCE